MIEVYLNRYIDAKAVGGACSRPAASGQRRRAAGVHLDYRADDRRSESFNLVPQVHLRLGSHFSLQGGVGLFLEDDSARTEAIFRVIYGF